MSSVPFFVIFLLGVLTYSAARGGGPERAVALAFFVASVASISVGFWRMPGLFQVVPMRLFIVDLLLLIALCMIALNANRYWPIAVAGCQLVAVLVHAAKLIDPQMFPTGYAFLIKIGSWPMVISLAIGTWLHRRRIVDIGFDMDWKHSLGPRRSHNQTPAQRL